jgi:hypothetical protein
VEPWNLGWETLCLVLKIKQLETTGKFDTAHAYIFGLQNAEAPIGQLTWTVPWIYT